MDAFRVAFDTVWDWAERRGVRVEYWRNAGEWQVEVVLADTEGDFTGSTPLRIFRPATEGRRATQVQLRIAYEIESRKALDDAVVAARARRMVWQQGRLK